MRQRHPRQRFVAPVRRAPHAVRQRHAGQRFVVPWGAPPKAPGAGAACANATQDSASWPHRELHRRL
eukprot:170400-Pyramimonas_sp.AAC.1